MAIKIANIGDNNFPEVNRLAPGICQIRCKWLSIIKKLNDQILALSIKNIRLLINISLQVLPCNSESLPIVWNFAGASKEGWK
jgi:hypothetical protein